MGINGLSRFQSGHTRHGRRPDADGLKPLGFFVYGGQRESAFDGNDEIRIRSKFRIGL